MANPDVTVNITDAGANVSSVDYGLILIITGEANKAYTEYDLSNGIENSGVEADYATSTKTYKQVNAAAGQVLSPDKIAIIGTDTLTGQPLIDSLNDMLVTNDTFFRVITNIAVTTDKLAIASWAETNKKFAYLQFDNTTFTEDYSGVAARLLFHKTADEYLDAAETGFFSTLVPGTTIPKFRTYTGITAQTLTVTEKTNAEAKNMGYYIEVVGIKMQRSSRASNWTSSAPKYIDDLESREYISKQMSDKLLSLMVNTPKLPGDINGLQMIDATIGNVLESSFNLNIIAANDDGSASYSTDISKATFVKSTREWNNIEFEYTYLHGTEEITVNGVVK